MEKWIKIITRHGGPIFCWLECGSFGRKFHEFIRFPVEYNQINVCKNGEYTAYLEGIKWNAYLEILKNKLQTDESFFQRMLKKLHDRLVKLNEFCKQKEFASLSNDQLGDIYSKYAELYTDIGPFYLVYYGLDPVLTDFIKTWLAQKVSHENVQEYFALLTTPGKPGYLIQEEYALIDIAKKISSNSKAKKFFEKGTSEIMKLLSVSFPKLNEEIEKHVEKYYWVPVERESERLNKRDVIERIVTMINKPREKKIFSDIKSKQKVLENKLKIPDDIKLRINQLRQLSVAVDEMKKVYTISHCFLFDFFDEVSKRLKLSSKQLTYLTPHELTDWLKNDTVASDEVINNRKNFVAIITNTNYPFDVELKEGKKASEIASELEKLQKPKKIRTIKGTSASIGKAIGFVRVLKSAKESDKLQKNEILVTSMTTPDYIMAIKKASAIVTDEGGITCHAAIVSREFGIPCVVGTHVATKVLKDGDKVMVDATKGIVKIMKAKQSYHRNP